MNIQLIRFSILLLMMSAFSQLAFAQWEMRSLSSQSREDLPAARTFQEGIDTILIDLPFWDDFSAADTIDSELWQIYKDVWVGPHLSINPPTVNIVTFNGANASGVPYSSDQGSFGRGDSLVSNFIQLDKVSAENRSSVYLSFFWQAGGLGDQPDQDDSLVLEFRSNLGNWYTIRKIDPVDVGTTQEFEQSIVAVDDNILNNPDETFFHQYFQFKFSAHGLLNGTFDNWHLDYIFLDQGRSPTDLAYFDRAMAKVPSFLFNGFGGVPFEQLLADPDRFVVRSQAEFNNLSSEGLQSLEFTARAEIQFEDSTFILDTMNFRTPLDPLPDAFERRTLQANPFDLSKLTQFSDSAEVQLWNTFILNSGDTILPNINYRLNDTVRSKSVVGEYFAYDDGSAEFGVGIGQSGGKVAYRFIMSIADTLTEIDINFPRIGRNLEGTGLRLMVWRDLNQTTQTTLLSQEDVIRYPDQENGFVSYKLGRPIVVRDTFYIGYEQFTDEFMPVGFDKNNDSQDKIFFSISGDGSWEQFDEAPGSLMIRPRFGRAFLTSIKDDPVIQERVDKIKIYPNPTTGLLYLQGVINYFQVLNLSGNVILESENRDELVKIDLHGLSAGIYLLKVFSPSKVTVRKIILQ